MSLRAASGLDRGQRVSAALSGAPLDVIKLVAAAAMVVDHTNKILFGFRSATAWYIGRTALPLFILAIVVHLLRGTKPWPYVQRLVVLAAISQPAYTIGLADKGPDTVFTLALGAIVALLLAEQARWVQHAAFAAVAVVVFTPALQPHAGLDYGIAGLMLPAALLLAIEAPRVHLPWLLLNLFELNYFVQSRPRDDVIAFLMVTLGNLAIVWLALRFRGRRRFLPGYAFYVFYPVHLLILAAIARL